MAVATEGLEKLEDMIVRQAEATGAQVAAAKAAIGSVIFGQEGVVEQALITVLCGGHALLIGLPGLAKTKLVPAANATSASVPARSSVSC
jgi:MoxR-like ATPase